MQAGCHRTLYILAGGLVVSGNIGCDFPAEDDIEQAAVAEAPGGPTHWADVDEVPPVPIDEPEPLEITPLHGVAELPDTHPCHDSTPVVSARDYREPKDGYHWSFELTTLGELRSNPDERWTHFGPRTVRGYRWSTEEADHLVATCNLGGLGISTWDGLHLPNAPAADQAVFVEGLVGEPNALERGELRWMSRWRGGDWTTTWREVLWSNNDESNNPQYVARSGILSATDSDRDRQPEVVGFTLQDCRRPYSEFCESPRTEWRRRFVVTLIAREGDHELREQIVLKPDGAVASRDREESPADMSNDAFETLSELLDANRKVSARARAILRDAKKLR